MINKKAAEVWQELRDSHPERTYHDYFFPTCLAWRPEVPFILVSGAVEADRARAIMAGGARDYIAKDRLNQLVPAIERALAAN